MIPIESFHPCLRTVVRDSASIQIFNEAMQHYTIPLHIERVRNRAVLVSPWGRFYIARHRFFDDHHTIAELMTYRGL